MLQDLLKDSRILADLGICGAAPQISYLKFVVGAWPGFSGRC